MDKKIVSTNPAENYKVIGEVECTELSSIPEIIKKSNIALAKWRSVGLSERKKYIRKIARLFKSRINELTKLISLEMGMPKDDAIFDISAGIKTIYDYIEQSDSALSESYFFVDNEKHTTIKEPLGVVFAIAPWNYPMGNFVWLCMQALLAGNVVIYKASSKIPLFCKKVETLINDVLPVNVFTAVYGNHILVEETINAGIDAVSLVGSTKAGIKVAELVAKNLIPVNLELGGSAPGIVLEDANLDLVVDKIILYRFINNGQTCDGLKRLLVDKKIEKKLTSKLLKKVKRLVVGNPLLNNDVDLGPLASEEQQKHLFEQVLDSVKKGGKVLCGGNCLPGGAYYEPTIVTNIRFDMKIWTEEVFGPVLPIVAFSNTEEAISLANDTVYGLGGYIFTNNDREFDRISKELKTCMINRNGTSYVRKENFFGGCKMSGSGRENSIRGFEHVTREKIISEQNPPSKT